nr:ATP-binding protein [Variovorax dokdonensis]
MGPSGSGKTELIKDICSRYKDRLGPQGHSQVMSVETPTAATEDALPLRIIEQLFGGMPRKYRKGEAMQRAVQALESAGIMILFADEINHFAEARSNVSIQTKANRRIADWFKGMSDAGKVSLVLTGLPHSRQLVIDNEQLLRRALRPIELKPYRWSVPQQRRAFAQVVAAFCSRMQECGWLVSIALEALVPRAYACSGGLIGALKKLFTSAEHLGRSERNLSADLLSRAYARAFDLPGIADPFIGKVPGDEVLNYAYQHGLGRPNHHAVHRTSHGPTT